MQQPITYFHRLEVAGDGNGGIQGASITKTTEYREDDGTLITVKNGEPLTVAMAEGDPGVPLAAALGDANVAALKTIDELRAQVASLTTERDAAVTAKAQAEAARDAALAQVTELQAQINGPVVDGVPQRVTMRQAQLALLAAGLLDNVDAAIAAIPDATQRRAAEITWAKSASVERSNSLIATLAGALGLSDAQIDALFVAAAKL